MSQLLEQAATLDAQRSSDMAKNDAEAIAADLAEDVGKAARRHAVSDARAIEAQLVEFRRAGYI